jgi:hypothetical protein
MYNAYINCMFIYPTVVQSYTIYNEAVNPLTPRQYAVVNRNSVFDLCDNFQEYIPGIKQELPVHYFKW